MFHIASITYSHYLIAECFCFLTWRGTSSVVNKQYFEVVCVPPANDLR